MSSPLLLRHRLPDEITLKILDFWIGIPHIRTEVRGQVECSRPRCPKSTRRNRKLLEGTPWAHEFDRTLTLMPKYFDEQLDLIATHMAVFGSSSSDGVVDRTRWIAAMPECFGHGLENIHLDLYPEEYIALFNVTIPPFDTIAWSNFNSKWPSSGAIDILQGTKELVLYFGDHYTKSNPWFDCNDDRWETEDANCFAPMCRPDICMQGKVVDWILSYAWQNGIIRHIEKIKLDGPVQQWVRDKWERIFRLSPRQRGSAYDIDLKSIETIGLDMVEKEEDWDPTEYYAPTCDDNCKPSCTEVLGLKGHDAAWKEMAWMEDIPTRPVGDWYDASLVSEPSGVEW